MGTQKFTGQKKLERPLAAFIFLVGLFLIGCGSSSSQLGALDTFPLEASQDHEVGIIGGKEVTEADPVAQSTVIIWDLLEQKPFCTGVLIERNLVLTAAHCTLFNPRRMAIGFGLKAPVGGHHVVLRPVVAGITHPKWSKLKSADNFEWGDVAVLRFERGLPAGFAPVALSSKLSDVANGTEVIIAGYGLVEGEGGSLSGDLRRSTELKRTEVILDKNAVINSIELYLPFYQERGPCRGDSGGPAFVSKSDSLVLVGVTSRSYTDAGAQNCSGGAVYTSVAGMLDFIKEAALKLNSGGFRPTYLPQPIFADGHRLRTDFKSF